MLRRSTVLLGFSLLLAAPAAAVTEVPLPLGADNVEFQFAPGTCRDNISLGHIGGSVATYTYRGCRNDTLRIDFVYNDQPTGMGLFGVFEEGSPQTIGRKNIIIIDAWWTKGTNSKGEGIFYQEIWPRGTSGKTGYVMTVPEPASWGLMLGGFGLVGAALRRQRRRAPIG
jgi:hypothetical protein